MGGLKSRLLEEVQWLRHGFGTRAGPLTQEGMVRLEQIHSSTVLLADRNQGCVGEGDALIAAQPDVTLSIRTADCLPILLLDPIHKVIAAVHAGWRGTAAHIVKETLARIQELHDTDPQDLLAAIGPGIGVCCYQVGGDVGRVFGLEGAGHIDLAAENTCQLEAAGVPRERIDCLSLCTCCHPEQFHSWRRDRDRAGRMISYIALS
jgi:YfiH family protein